VRTWISIGCDEKHLRHSLPANDQRRKKSNAPLAALPCWMPCFFQMNNVDDGLLWAAAPRTPIPIVTPTPPQQLIFASVHLQVPGTRTIPSVPAEVPKHRSPSYITSRNSDRLSSDSSSETFDTRIRIQNSNSLTPSQAQVVYSNQLLLPSPRLPRFNGDYSTSSNHTKATTYSSGTKNIHQNR
jgi:hypothetical protein